jgi:hypothetical protein
MYFTSNELFFDFYAVRIEQISPQVRYPVFFTGPGSFAFDNPIQINI